MGAIASALFPIEPGLLGSSRAWSLARRDRSLSAAELAVLAACGAAAATASCSVELHLGIPGHVVLRGVFPMLLGLSLVPRRGVGSLMGLCALLTALGLRATNLDGWGTGSFTSMLAIGPLLDVSMLNAPSGWRLYVRSAAAGMMANLVAWMVHIGAAAGGSSGNATAHGWKRALVSYLICGAVAGLASAAVWFRFVARKDSPEARRKLEPQP